MTPTSPPPLVGLAIALVVLIGGIAAALSKDDSSTDRSGPAITSSNPPRLVTTTTTVRSSSSSPTVSTTLPSTSLPTTPTTVRPAVPSPEAAANGLWAAYSSANRQAAARFATQAVVDFLFSTPDTGEPGTFEGCRQTGAGQFVCDYDQPSAHFTMTAEADANRSYKIVDMSIDRAVTTTTDSFST